MTRQAEQLLAILPPAEVNTSAFGYNEAQLRFHAGNALTHLGRGDEARRHQQRLLALYPITDYMDRALTMLDRTICLAQQDDALANQLPEHIRGVDRTHRSRQAGTEISFCS
ncbi:hypothetical protein ACIBHX_48965 [Nonomuraea sp. NPDC050536]|uniref:hypothetical protein n=1 Tax=Nonomuraea sp. NPDC050536 TaxID=3364366 RepID=UPI0037C71BF1